MNSLLKLVLSIEPGCIIPFYTIYTIWWSKHLYRTMYRTQKKCRKFHLKFSGLPGGPNTIWDLVRGLIPKSAIGLFVFYVYVLYFIMWSAIEQDVYTLGLTRCVFSSLLWLKPQCSICTIGYTERKWCHIVATTTRKISAQHFESQSLSETSTKACREFQ